jgi:hypothetical protein
MSSATHNVPDHVVFGPKASGGDFTYGEVRALNRQEQVEALRRRFEKWLIGQSEPIAESGASPFPLAVMTCVGIEALGQIAFGPGSALRDPFVSVAPLLDSRLGNALTATFLSALNARWATRLDAKADPAWVATVGELLYTFFRNSMIHGYRGRAVFLSEDQVADLALNETEGTMTVNPSWLWRCYVEAATEVFDKIESSSDARMRANAEGYLAIMLA